jgi:Ser/Thr protein kinase RdoA (MazF antagonist)
MLDLNPAHHRISYFSEDQTRALLAEHFGVVGTLTRLPGYVEQNYRVQVPEGPGWVLKITPTDAPTSLLEMQTEALNHIAGALHGIATPLPLTTITGEPLAWAEGEDGPPHALRLLTYLPGEILAAAKPRSRRLLESLGGAVGCLHGALDGFEHSAAHQEDGDWDLTRTVEVVSALIGSVVTPEHRAMVDRIKECFAANARGHLIDLPSGVIHGDLNDHNVLVSPPAREGRQVSGILDFGDLVFGPFVADLAVAAAYGCLGAHDLLGACAAVVRGYLTQRSLSEAEANVLYPLIRGRLAITVVHSCARSGADREDPYLTVHEAAALEAIEELDGIHPRIGRAAMREAAGYPA